MPDERRQGVRYNIWFPVQISTDEGGTLAVNHNVGGGGMLLATGAELEPGQKVSITFTLPPNGPERRAEGKIVRVEENAEDPEGTWPNRVAVVFDVADEELETLLEEANQRVSQID